MSRRRLWVPEIYVPKTTHAGLDMPSIGIAGYYRVELIRRGIIIFDSGWHKNLIVDNGMNAIKPSDGTSIVSMLNFMAVGTGSTAPANSDTGLVSEITPASSNRTSDDGGIADVTAIGSGNSYASLQRVRVLSESQANGNLTEMGWFTASSGGTMFSRMLFKDGTGTPTTIVKTSDDQLRVTYEIRLFIPTSDVTGSITISGTLYDFTIRAAQVNNASAWVIGPNGAAQLGNQISTGGGFAYETQTLGAVTGLPLGANAICSSRTWASYTSGSFVRDADYVWNPADGNFATGIGAITGFGRLTSANAVLFQSSWNPKFSKDNTKRLTLTMRHSWTRH